jgi:hypothetical protein
MDIEDLAAGVEFEDFAVAELGGLLRYSVMLTGDRELARDLVQDVMLKAYTQWSASPPRISPGSMSDDGDQGVSVMASSVGSSECVACSLRPS